MQDDKIQQEIKDKSKAIDENKLKIKKYKNNW